MGPYNLCEVASLYQQELVTGDTQALLDTEQSTWQPLRAVVPSLSSVVTVSALSQKIIAGLSPTTANRDTLAERVTVTDVAMPFGSMVTFMIKWAIAAIPAAIILTLLFVFLTAFFGAFIGGLVR